VTSVLVGLNVGNEHSTYAHSVLAVLGHVDRGLKSVPQFELVSHNRDNLHEGQFFDQLLGALVI